MKRFKEHLKESSLSRIWGKMQEHDTGVITAYRNQYTKKENMGRNKELFSAIKSKGYDVTTLKGSYIENYGKPDAVEVGETVFFISDIKDKGNLQIDIQKLGEEYDQDSILFIPKSGNNSILIGTNKTGYPGYGKSITYSERQMGSAGEFFSRVKGRPFLFK